MKKYQREKRNIVLTMSAALLVSGCQNHHNSGNEYIQAVAVDMQASSQSNVNGEVKFLDNEGMVSMKAQFTGLQPGPHAIHIHADADCSAEDGKSAGGHWNPSNEKHGKWGADSGYHKGDVGNFTVNNQGSGSIYLETDEWCVGCDDRRKNVLGKSVIVHQGTDDFTSQPSGDAGTRIACGEILN